MSAGLPSFLPLPAVPLAWNGAFASGRASLLHATGSLVEHDPLAVAA